MRHLYYTFSEAMQAVEAAEQQSQSPKNKNWDILHVRENNKG